MNWKALALVTAVSLTATLAACGKPPETAAPDAMKSPAGDAMGSPDAMKSPDAMTSPSPATP